MQTQPPIAKAVDLTKNAKLGPVSATYASQSSCPPSCPLFQAGCYAEQGNTGIHTRALNRRAATPQEVADAEAAAIRERLSGRFDLRLHVVGDCTTNEAAATVAEAALAVTRPGNAVFSYTHSWAQVDRAAWGTVSVLASVEAPHQVEAAAARGYAAAMIVPIFPGDRRYTDGGVQVVPCPAQTRQVTCVECRLCLHADKLLARGVVIGFEAHGSRYPTVRALATRCRTDIEREAQAPVQLSRRSPRAYQPKEV